MKKQLEISFIDNNILFNLLQRGSSSSKSKNNFIIYDISGGQCVADDYQNCISLNDDISKFLIQSKDEAVKLTEIQKILPKDKEELFSKSKRFFNFLLVQPKDSEFLTLLNKVIFSFQKKSIQDSEEEQKSTQLLHSGQIKVDCETLMNEVEKKLSENPDIEAKCGSSILNWRKSIAFYKVLRHNKIVEIHILRQSAEHFFGSYSFMSDYFVSLNGASQQTYPNDILCNRLYFGNWKHASNEEIINSIGITHIVNMTCEVDNYFASNRKTSISHSSSFNQTLKITSSTSSSSYQFQHNLSSKQPQNNESEQQLNQENQYFFPNDLNNSVQKLVLEDLPQLNLSESKKSSINNVQTSTLTATITTTTSNNNCITKTITTSTTPMQYTKDKSNITPTNTPQNVTYLKINIDDEDTSNIYQHFKETYKFISSALKKPSNKVLIHCAQGKSRSATIVCMYLMRTFKWSFDKTLKYVQDRREVANPNYGFVEQLKKFEEQQFKFEGETQEEWEQSQKQIAHATLEFYIQDGTHQNNNQYDQENVKMSQSQDQNKQDVQVIS